MTALGEVRDGYLMPFTSSSRFLDEVNALRLFGCLKTVYVSSIISQDVKEAVKQMGAVPDIPVIKAYRKVMDVINAVFGERVASVVGRPAQLAYDVVVISCIPHKISFKCNNNLRPFE